MPTVFDKLGVLGQLIFERFSTGPLEIQQFCPASVGFRHPSQGPSYLEGTLSTLQYSPIAKSHNKLQDVLAANRKVGYLGRI